MEEIWKDIPGYENYYQASNLGRIRSKDRLIIVNDYQNAHAYFKGFSYVRPGKVLKARKNMCGYLTVPICINKKTKSISVHRLVAKTFIENKYNLPQVNHIDENKLNNSINNLEWCTEQYNMNYNNLVSRRAFKQRTTNSRCKKIISIDSAGKETEYISIRGAARELNLNQANIQAAIKYSRRCGRLYWKIKN